MRSLALAILFVLISPNVRADTVLLASGPEMLAGADFIAIIEFRSAKQGVFKGPAAYPKQEKRVVKQFSRCVSARVIENLKGELPEQVQIHDCSGFWDALFQNHGNHENADSGRYLIFLSGDVNFLTGSNGWASTARISGEEIEWNENPNSPKFQMVNLKEMLDRVRKGILINPGS
ncbi:MAG TPA: hypothetical protein VF614_01435 [Chthoniobacteraceae bacterium]|jgi:hypothetical protein